MAGAGVHYHAVLHSPGDLPRHLLQLAREGPWAARDAHPGANQDNARVGGRLEAVKGSRQSVNTPRTAVNTLRETSGVISEPDQSVTVSIQCAGSPRRKHSAHRGPSNLREATVTILDPPGPGKRGNPRSSAGYARHQHDWYLEPRWAADGILDVEKFKGACWDPARGASNIVELCLARGPDSWGSDIADRGYGKIADFFATDWTAPNIICKPPARGIVAFVDRALEKTTGKVVVFVRLAFLEGQLRGPWFEQTRLTRVWFHSARVCCRPGDSGAEPKNGSTAFAWFVWQHGDAVGPWPGLTLIAPEPPRARRRNAEPAP